MNLYTYKCSLCGKLEQVTHPNFELVSKCTCGGKWEYELAKQILLEGD